MTGCIGETPFLRSFNRVLHTRPNSPPFENSFGNFFLVRFFNNLLKDLPPYFISVLLFNGRSFCKQFYLGPVFPGSFLQSTSPLLVAIFIPGMSFPGRRTDRTRFYIPNIGVILPRKPVSWFFLNLQLEAPLPGDWFFPPQPAPPPSPSLPARPVRGALFPPLPLFPPSILYFFTFIGGHSCMFRALLPSPEA